MMCSVSTGCTRWFGRKHQGHTPPDLESRGAAPTAKLLLTSPAPEPGPTGDLRPIKTPAPEAAGGNMKYLPCLGVGPALT